MSPIVAGIGGLLIGLAIGWFVGMGTRGGSSANAPELVARQKAMEEEHKRLARELSQRERSISDLSDAQEHAKLAAQENRKLIRRVRDLEAALKSATAGEDRPSAALEMQLVMAMRERDAAQKALMDVEAQQAIDRSRPPPGELEPESFDALPELDDTDETEDVSDPGPFTADEETADDPVPPSEDGPTELDSDDADAPGELEEDDETDEDTALPEERDDLKRISGIGPATHRKLVALGYETFRSLADLDDDQVKGLETELGSKRPSRDDWRGQAAALVSSRQEDA